MTRDDIIRMAREANFAEGLSDNLTREVLVWDAETKHLERFAALVAAAEREACAKVCEDYGPARVLSGEDCAAAIRARGEMK
jgi:hypothetical protein